LEEDEEVMRNKIHKFNEWFDSKGYYTRSYMAMAALLLVGVIGAFVFHSVASYFIMALILIYLRRI